MSIRKKKILFVRLITGQSSLGYTPETIYLYYSVKFRKDYRCIIRR